MEMCKTNSTYLNGDIELSNVKPACTNYNMTSPRWIGVVRDQYIKKDEGKVNFRKAFDDL